MILQLYTYITNSTLLLCNVKNRLLSVAVYYHDIKPFLMAMLSISLLFSYFFLLITKRAVNQYRCRKNKIQSMTS